MTEYSDAANRYTLSFPEGWLPLTHENSPHISLASLTTGGYLKIESYQFEPAASEPMRPEATLRALIDSEKLKWPQVGEPPVRCGFHSGIPMAYTTFTRPESGSGSAAGDFGHARAWVFCNGQIQVRCLYRCRVSDQGDDNDDLEGIIASLALNSAPPLDAASFSLYYYNLLKRHRPQLATQPPVGLTLTLVDGQTVLLEQLYHHYLIEPQRMDELIDTHLDLLDYCGDDVPDLTRYDQVRPLIFPKMMRVNSRRLTPHRIAFWPGLEIGAVVRGRVFTYGVNVERLQHWGMTSLSDLRDVLLENLQSVSPVAPRGLRDDDGSTRAISYVDHPYCASFVLFDDFYETTAHNLGVEQFLVGLPDPSCVSCFGDADPKFVVQHTALLRWDYHRSVEPLTDTIYLVNGPAVKDVQPYDILHCCPKKA